MGLVRRYADRPAMASSGGQSCKYSLPHEMLTAVPSDVVVDGDLLHYSPTPHVDVFVGKLSEHQVCSDTCKVISCTMINAEARILW
jgi:hypothetical protein